MAQICATAKKHNIVVSLGFSENDNNSVYIAQATIDSDGKLLMHRRKLKPTHMERTIFGDGSGNDLMNVVDTKLGKRVGSLACWEHCQPLLKYHTATQREDFHVAGWPALSKHAGPELWSMSAEGTCPYPSRFNVFLNRRYRLPIPLPNLRHRNPIFRPARHHGHRH